MLRSAQERCHRINLVFRRLSEFPRPVVREPAFDHLLWQARSFVGDASRSPHHECEIWVGIVVKCRFDRGKGSVCFVVERLPQLTAVDQDNALKRGDFVTIHKRYLGVSFVKQLACVNREPRRHGNRMSDARFREQCRVDDTLCEQVPKTALGSAPSARRPNLVRPLINQTGFYRTPPGLGFGLSDIVGDPVLSKDEKFGAFSRRAELSPRRLRLLQTKSRLAVAAVPVRNHSFAIEARGLPKADLAFRQPEPAAPWNPRGSIAPRQPTRHLPGSPRINGAGQRNLSRISVLSTPKMDVCALFFQ